MASKLKAMGSIFRYIPCCFIAAIAGWSYYAMMVYVFLEYYKNLGNIPLLLVLVVIYNIIIFLMLWSWLKTIITFAGTCANKFKLSNDEQDHYNSLRTGLLRDEYLEKIVKERNLTVVTRHSVPNRQNEIRFCRKTGAIKPDRAHFDSMTKKLVLKMDHYCPWVSNVVGYSNYKFFVLFIFYALMYCITIMLVTIFPFLAAWESNTSSLNRNSSNASIILQRNSENTSEIYNSSFRLQVILVFLVASIFSISIACLFFFHFYLVSNNRSTLEVYGKPIIRNIGPHKHAFNIGFVENWKQVFGDQIFLALIPVKYDHPDLEFGHKFPLNDLLRMNSVLDHV